MKKLVFVVVATVAISAQGVMGVNSYMLKQGKNIFAKNCAVCHGKNAEGKGKFPSLKAGHVSHHLPQKLFAQIEKGGGGMPPFKNRLSRQEIRAVFIYIHSLWSDKMREDYRKKFQGKGMMK